MASFVRDTGNSLTPVQHSNKLFFEHIKPLTAKGYVGPQGSGKPFVLDNTLKGKAGDTVRHTFIPYVHATPIRGQNTTIQGNENSFNEFGLDVTIDEVHFAFKKRGRMTDQRTLYDARMVLSKQIAQNFEQFNETQLIKVASGMTFSDDDMTTFKAAATATDVVSGANRLVRCSGANGSSGTLAAADSDNAALIGAMTTADKLNLRAIEDARLIGRSGDSSLNDTASSVTNTYKMRPMRMDDGEEVFLLLVSLACARDLRNSDEFQSHVLSLADRGWTKSPLAKGALGIWDNVIIKPSEHIIEFGSGTNKFARNLLLGADAVFCGWAQTLDYTEQMNDYDRELGSDGCEIRGEKKIKFNGVDMGVLQLIASSNV